MFEFFKYWNAYWSSVKEDYDEFRKYCKLIDVDEDVIKNYNRHCRKISTALKIISVGRSSRSHEDYIQETHDLFYPDGDKYSIHYWLNRSSTDFDPKYAGALAVRIYMDYEDTSLQYAFQLLADITSTYYTDPVYMDRVVTPIVDNFHRLLDELKSTHNK